MRFVDPDGRQNEDVIISGDLDSKAKAFNELQSSVNGQLDLSMGADGKISYKLEEGAELSADAQQLVNAIDDHSVVVSLNATKSSSASGIGGDSFEVIVYREIK